MLEFLFLLLPIAAASGWYIAVRSQKGQTGVNIQQQMQHYALGINYLLNEQPDQAVELFIKALEIDSNTVETHLALGSLFRRRGEVDKAIRIHQNLIARPQLNKSYKIRALLALSQDYLKAGFLDRSEPLFLDVLASGEYIDTALQGLMDIYQQQRNWSQAIHIIQRYQSKTTAPVHIPLAHYYCELAEAQLAQNPADAKVYLEKALRYDAYCARANISLAKIAIKTANFKAAIKAYQAIRQQDPEYFPEIISAMAACYDSLNKEKIWLDYLWECYQQRPSANIMLMLANRLVKSKGPKAAIDFISEQLNVNPSLKGLHYLIILTIATEDITQQEKLQTLKDIVQQLLTNTPSYRCKHCGMRSKMHYWQCPACRHWRTVKPIDWI